MLRPTSLFHGAAFCIVTIAPALGLVHGSALRLTSQPSFQSQGSFHSSHSTSKDPSHRIDAEPLTLTPESEGPLNGDRYWDARYAGKFAKALQGLESSQKDQYVQFIESGFLKNEIPRSLPAMLKTLSRADGDLSINVGSSLKNPTAALSSSHSIRDLSRGSLRGHTLPLPSSLPSRSFSSGAKFVRPVSVAHSSRLLLPVAPRVHRRPQKTTVIAANIG